MTFHTQRLELQYIGRHILEDQIHTLNFNIKRSRNLESDPSYHLLKKALKKVQIIAWKTSLFNGCTLTHTHTLATHRERFAITFWKEKISSKGLNFKKKWRKNSKVLIVKSVSLLFKQAMKKRSKLASNISSFNACLRLSAFKLNLGRWWGVQYWMDGCRPANEFPKLGRSLWLPYPHKTDLSNPPVRIFLGFTPQK